jgi:hypothetical protein
MKKQKSIFSFYSFLPNKVCHHGTLVQQITQSDYNNLIHVSIMCQSRVNQLTNRMASCLPRGKGYKFSQKQWNVWGVSRTLPKNTSKCDQNFLFRFETCLKISQNVTKSFGPGWTLPQSYWKCDQKFSSRLDAASELLKTWPKVSLKNSDLP